MSEPYNPSPLGNPSLLKRRSWPETQLVKFIGRHTPKCTEVVRILSQGMDQKLTLKTRLLLNMHYLICRWCQRYSEHLRYLRKFSRRFPEQIFNPRRIYNACEHKRSHQAEGWRIGREDSLITNGPQSSWTFQNYCRLLCFRFKAERTSSGFL
jgi:hypothetical protein